MTRRGYSARDGIMRVRPAGNPRLAGGQLSTGQLSVPAHMVRALPEGAEFIAEWTEEGILYRFIGVASGRIVTRPDPNAPPWTKTAVM